MGSCYCLVNPRRAWGTDLTMCHKAPYMPVLCEAHVCGREDVKPQCPYGADTTALLLLSPWAGWVRYFCQTCVTRRGGVTPSKIYCFPPAASAAPPLGVSAGTVAPAPHSPRLKRQHPGTNPSVPASLSARALPCWGLAPATSIRCCNALLLCPGISSTSWAGSSPCRSDTVCPSSTKELYMRNQTSGRPSEIWLIGFNRYRKSQIKIFVI